MRNIISMSLPDINEEDVSSVGEVVRSGRLALGPKNEEFEAAIAGFVGVKHAVTVSSGTAALHLIVRSLDLKTNDEILVPSFTFAASVNSFLYEGARPVFIDIEDETYTIDHSGLERNINNKTKAIMVVDVFGHPAEWDEIKRIAEKYELKVIDDSCEAIGAEYKDRKLGQFGDAAAFAFYPNKQMTTGEGGVIVTDDDSIADMCRSMRNQGRGEMNSWLIHDYLGYNYRLDEMSAALGVSQLKRLDDLLKKREAVAKLYTQKLTEFDWVRPPVVKPYVHMSWFVYVVTLAEGLNRDEIIREMEKEGIPARGYFSPIHTQKYIRKLFGNLEGTLPVTESVAKRTLALPFHNNIRNEDVDIVVDALKHAVMKYA